MTATTPRHEPASASLQAPAGEVRGSGSLWALRDTWAMTRRNLRTSARQPQLLVFALVQPVIFILLFRYVFGGAIAGPGPVDYVDFLLTGIFVQTITIGAVQTGVGLSEDASKGVIDRLKSMPITRGAVLAGRVCADLVRNAGVVAVMVAVGYLVGFEFTNGVLGAVLAVLVLLLWGFAFSWVGAFLGLALRTPEAVQAASFPLVFPLVFASSIFVPVETMPGWLQAFVQVNPISLVTGAVRALALGEPFELMPDLAWAALASVVVVAVFAPLAIRRYQRL
ncbi:ABC transporter permease [Quadrisphaera sp. DSM 44207]|uniref:ABC transporter permease n=1 Tax=Quadrisphaera sp. DSM 44207 TaxID=1881057 RepID=UPI000880D5FA|nr:ABC transporter permease [Quadrisphaera sp. DSM 44207]SDQ05209.1 ABC-2 type transport system permease protein/oleandomycin transport system permease protein [Quadrisphaera sp. DSM 44207]